MNVYNCHDPKESSAKPNDEYSLLTEECPPALNSPAASATPSAAAMGEHDYDEPYFEPACKEDELLLQLQKLGVACVSKKSLKYVRQLWLHNIMYSIINYYTV